MEMPFDRHHVVHNRQEWSLRPEAFAIREHPSLITRIDRQLHNEIHRACPAIPLLGFHTLRRVLHIWEPDTDISKSVDNLSMAMEEAANHPRSSYVESELARLAAHAVNLQLPFLSREVQYGNVL